MDDPLGTIYKQRRQFFRIFAPPLPHVGIFLVLSVGNFDQFLTPPPLPIDDVFYGRPLGEKRISDPCSLCLSLYTAPNKQNLFLIYKLQTKQYTGKSTSTWTSSISPFKNQNQNWREVCDLLTASVAHPIQKKLGLFLEKSTVLVSRQITIASHMVF